MYILSKFALVLLLSTYYATIVIGFMCHRVSNHQLDFLRVSHKWRVLQEEGEAQVEEEGEHQGLSEEEGEVAAVHWVEEGQPVLQLFQF